MSRLDRLDQVSSYQTSILCTLVCIFRRLGQRLRPFTQSVRAYSEYEYDPRPPRNDRLLRAFRASQLLRSTRTACRGAAQTIDTETEG